MSGGRTRGGALRIARICAGLLGLLAFSGCSGEEAASDTLAGSWRAVLDSPGGELPFELRFLPAGSVPPAVAVNGQEEAPFTHVEVDRERVLLRIDGYDSEIVARLDVSGDRMAGDWSRMAEEGISTLPFSAERGFPHRFQPSDELAASGTAVAGEWVVSLVDDDGTQPATASFRQHGSRVTGNFRTPAGDYRYLEGDLSGDLLRLSSFDGGHVFLFRARLGGDGTLVGDFWSRDLYHATWTARRQESGEEDALPDPFAVVGLRNDEGRFSFSFPDLDGNAVSLADARFRGKVVLVNLFGSWCPNCNDEAPVLGELHRRYRERGLEIVGLAFEFTGDPVRDGAFVRKFGQRHDVRYPLLLAGVGEKERAAQALPDLTSVVAFPTTIFVGRDGRVRRIHSGFEGPGTGDHHRLLVAEFESIIQELLLEEPLSEAPSPGDVGPPREPGGR